ncbi:GNAT family N-acetyltransferase [Nocardia macrotermitis]|uniref:N-acetyltransferase domain-containing protein n=1 Tax=Nocardia macrotermitis TaxID=2585198 RepID=A0A7K0CZL1_9NOCA|nr:hypothetical protein [Nocardia macrotermitis]
MRIRMCTEADLVAAVDITIEVFGPFYEQTFRAMVTPEVFEHQHDTWDEDYRRMVPGLLCPTEGRHVAVAEERGEIVGYVAWHSDSDRRHGEIDVLCVRGNQRGKGIGRMLCERAIAGM